MDIIYKWAFYRTVAVAAQFLQKDAAERSIVPNNTLEARWEETDVEGGLRSFVSGESQHRGGEGSAQGSAPCDHVTLEDSTRAAEELERAICW